MLSNWRSLLLAVLLVACASIPPARAADKAVRLIAEAEDFSVERGWVTVPFGENYFASTFAITFLSRQACLGALEQCDPEAVASQIVEVPVADTYQVLTRYEQPYEFAVEFSLEIVQGKAVVYRRTFGRLDSPKFWAFQKGKQAPMQRWFWGGGDNIVWEAGDEVKLARGAATLRLIAGRQLDGDRPRARAARRHVDLVCLTNDRDGMAAQQQTKINYLPFDGWLVQDGDLYVRVTNPADGLGPCVPVIAPYPSGQHSPWWVHHRDWPTTKLLRSGRIVSPTAYQYAGPRSSPVKSDLLAPELDPDRFKKVPPEEHLQPGQTTGWAPMGQVLDALHRSKWLPQTQYLKGGTELDLELEFAIPDGKGGLKPVKKVRVKGRGGYPHSPIAFEMPGNVRADPTIRTHREALEWLRDQVARFPKKGPVPQRFPIWGIMGFSGVLGDQGELGRLAAEIALALGDNTLTRQQSPHAEALGVPLRRTAQAVGHWPATEKGMRAACDKAQAVGTLDQIALVSYGDEHYVPPAKISDEQLVDWLKQKSIAVDVPVRVASDPKDPLYYYSQLCAFEKGVETWAAATRHLAERTGGKALAGINYGPASHNLVDELNFVRAFKLRGLSLAWSEDYFWQMPEFSVQIAGYRTTGFRAGTKYHGQPILQYVMPHRPGNTPRDVRLSFYTNVAHGASRIHFYCATPSAVGTTENYIASRDLDMFRTVHDLCHEAGVFEDYVLDGKVRRARVGLLLSSVDDIRNPNLLAQGGFTNAGRKAIYFGLRHAQVPVDFLSEEDVIDGQAADYQVLYVTQEYLHSRVVPALQRWVERGGTLVALGGGGFLDEFNRPNPEIAKLYGVKSQSLTKDDRYPVFQFKQDLPSYQPLDLAGWGASDRAVKNVPVILWKQALESADGRVIGKYRNGSPAVIEKAHGKGRAVLFGFMAGLAYLKSGLPLRPWDRGSTDQAYCHFLPTGMDSGLRRALVDEFLPEGFVRPVESSEPLVETTCIDTASPARLAVPLVNYSGKPIAALTVQLNGMNGARRVRSVERGELKWEAKGDALSITLPIDVTDMLLIDR